MAKKLLHRCIGVHARGHVNSCREYTCIHMCCWSSLFLTRVGVYVGVWVCIRTHAHTLHRWGTLMWAQGSGWDAHTHTHCTDGVLWCEPRGRDETPGGPRESRWTKSWHICIRMCVQSTHVCVYARRRDEILDQLLFSLTYFFLRKRKAKDVNANHRYLKSKIDLSA